jgi:hypothetical protein
MTNIVFLSIDNAHPPTLIVNNPPRQKCIAVCSYIYDFNNVKLGSYLCMQKHDIANLQLSSKSLTSIQMHLLFAISWYSTYKLERCRISTLGQKRLEILVFNTQCIQLIEYTRLTTKYLNLWLFTLL